LEQLAVDVAAAGGEGAGVAETLTRTFAVCRPRFVGVAPEMLFEVRHVFTLRVPAWEGVPRCGG
jgi:hypothetical protein